MVFHSYKGTKPQVAEEVFVAPGAQVIGQVTLAQGSSVWFNCVLRGDVNVINVGEGSNIQDLTMLHGEVSTSVEIGKNVTIGHTCVIHGCTIGDNSLIGMGTIILNRARIGENSLVGAGSLVTEDKEFPPNSVIMGRPAKVVRQVNEQDLAMMCWTAQRYRERAREFPALSFPV